MTADEVLFREELQTKSREELIETACRLMGELRAAQIRLDETSRGITEMSLQFSQMQDTVRGLESENRFLKEENERLTAKSTLRTKDVFGRSTEKADDIPSSSFNSSTAPVVRSASRWSFSASKIYGLEKKKCGSTSAAAQTVAQEKRINWAAICTKQAADEYGLKVCPGHFHRAGTHDEVCPPPERAAREQLCVPVPAR